MFRCRYLPHNSLAHRSFFSFLAWEGLELRGHIYNFLLYGLRMRFDGKMPFDPESLYSLSLRRFGGLLYFDVAWDSSLGNPCTATRNFRGITLPEHVCNALITHFSSRRRAFREMLLLFSDPQLCRVTQANLRIPPGGRGLPVCTVVCCCRQVGS